MCPRGEHYDSDDDYSDDDNVVELRISIMNFPFKELGSSRFYEALEGPTVLLNMTSYGHVDMMDQTYVDIIQVLVSIIINNCSWTRAEK